MAAVDDRRKTAYDSATSLSLAELIETFGGGENAIEAIATISKTTDLGTVLLRVADRPKYVGNNYYEGRAEFPVIKRTMGELQAPTIQFSETDIDVANMDGFYNQYLVSGASYISFIGAVMTIMIGLRDIASSFMTIFQGTVPEQDGFSRTREKLTIRARDVSDTLNKKVPLPLINDVDFPSAPPENLGKIIPMALGDWQVGYNYDVAATVTSVTSAGTTYDIVTDAPNNFYGGLVGLNVGGGYFVFSIGTYTPDNIAVAHIKRGDGLLQCTFNVLPQSTAGYWSLQVNDLVVSGGGFIPYVYVSGDVATISVKVPYSPGQYSNAIYQAEQILKTLGGKVSGDFDFISWNNLKFKVAPPQSDMTSIKSRIWVGKDKDTVLGNALSLLEQVRVELYIDKNQKIALKALHPEDFPDPTTVTRVEQAQISESTTKVKADDRTFFNTAAGNYAYTPILDKTQLQTKQRQNANSITKAGKTVSKAIDFPNLYVESDVQNQVDEFVRLYSTGLEYLEVEVAWMALLQDLGDFVTINYSIGGISYVGVPMMVRNISINLKTGSVLFNLLSFANFSYSSYSPSNAGRFLSSSSATITDV